MLSALFAWDIISPAKDKNQEWIVKGEKISGKVSAQVKIKYYGNKFYYYSALLWFWFSEKSY